MDAALIALLLLLTSLGFALMPLWPWSIGWGWVPACIPGACALVIAVMLLHE